VGKTKGIYINFLRDVACQKLLNSVNVSRSYLKNNTGTVFLTHDVYCGCHRKTSAGILFLTFLQSHNGCYGLTTWRFCVPKFADIEPGLLELFGNVAQVRFIETRCSHTCK